MRNGKIVLNAPKEEVERWLADPVTIALAAHLQIEAERAREAVMNAVEWGLQSDKVAAVATNGVQYRLLRDCAERIAERHFEGASDE